MAWTVWSASHSGDLDLLLHCLKHGQSVNAENAWGESPLHLAAEQGQVGAIHELLRHGALLDIRNYQRRTPLFLAVCRKQLDAVRALLARGADVNAEDDVRPFLSMVLHASSRSTRHRHRSWAVGLSMSQTGATPLSVARDSGDTVLFALLESADCASLIDPFAAQDAVVPKGQTRDRDWDARPSAATMPCPLGTGRVILRRLEGLYRENVEATRNRAHRLRSFASGRHYPADAASQVPPLRVNAVRSIRLGSDQRRLQRPVWDWSSADLAEWAFRSLEHPETVPPVLSPAEQLHRVVGRRRKAKDSPKDEIGDASVDVRPGGLSSRGAEAHLEEETQQEEEAGKEEGRAEGEDGAEGEEEQKEEERESEGTGSDPEFHEREDHRSDDDDGDEHGSPGPGGFASEGSSAPPGATNGQTHPEPPAPAWSSVEPFSGTEWGSAAPSWLTWLETTGMKGRHVAMLTRHGSGRHSLRWLWQRVGAAPRARRLLAEAMAQRCLDDGSADRARRAESLPVVHVVDVDVSGSAEMRVVGEVTVQTSDSFATVRERIHGIIHAHHPEEKRFPFDEESLQFLGGQTYRPVLRSEESVWKAFATGFAVFVSSAPRGEAGDAGRPPTEGGGPRPPVPGRETLREQVNGEAPREDAGQSPSPSALLADAVPNV